jgi:hypothetical protein
MARASGTDKGLPLAGGCAFTFTLAIQTHYSRDISCNLAVARDPERVIGSSPDVEAIRVFLKRLVLLELAQARRPRNLSFACIFPALCIPAATIDLCVAKTLFTNLAASKQTGQLLTPRTKSAINSLNGNFNESRYCFSGFAENTLCIALPHTFRWSTTTDLCC